MVSESESSLIERKLDLIQSSELGLHQAKTKSVSQLKRLKYLCSSSRRLDDFFENQIEEVKREELNQFTSCKSQQRKKLNSDLTNIRSIVQNIVNEQYSLLNNQLLPILEKNNIRFIRREKWSVRQRKWLFDYFTQFLLPVLSPIGLDITHPFPPIQNKSLCFMISLVGKDAFGRNREFAVVQAPTSLPNIVQLPNHIKGNGKHDYVFVSSIIHAFVGELFHGLTVLGSYQFRVTRGNSLSNHYSATTDINSSYGIGEIVRLEIDHNCPKKVLNYLRRALHVQLEDVYLIEGPVNLDRIAKICDIDESKNGITFQFYHRIVGLFSPKETTHRPASLILKIKSLLAKSFIKKFFIVRH